MIYRSHALSARFLLIILAACCVLLLLAVLFLGHAQLGGMPVLAQESMAVIN
jgi:hypothetical protein